MLKVPSILVFIFISFSSFSQTCEFYTGHILKEEVCWNEKHNGWISKRCMNSKKPCMVNDFFSETKKMIKNKTLSEGGQNPASLICRDLNLKIVVLKDKNQNEQSFCIFPDQSLADSNSILGNTK